jgi:hypothetical protein
MDALLAHIKEQDSEIHRVSDELEMRSAASQVSSAQLGIDKERRARSDAPYSNPRA